MSVCLAVQDLSKKYQSFQALAPVSFQLNAGEIVVLSGSNGSGKTTLLSCLSGLIRPTTGEVRVAGYDLYRDEREARIHLMYVPDVPRFYLELTAWEHLKFVAMANDVMQGFDQRAERLLRTFDLWEERDLFPHHFSRGMRLKLGLLLAFIRPFDVLLMDEPTSAMDVESVGLLREELLRLRGEGAAVLMSTHDPSLADHIADHRFRMDQGILEIG